jgi:hypothetical protein
VGDWRREAEILLDSVGFVPTSIAVSRHEPNERLLIVTIMPSVVGAALIVLVVSASELIVSAGGSTRFELDALPASRDEATALIRAVASGGLTERVGAWRVKSQLRLADGSTRRSGRVEVGAHFRRRRLLSYAPYESVQR